MNTEMNRKQIGMILSELRRSRGETLSEVAEAIGTSQGAISNYENGDRIPRDEIKILISKHYGVPVESIFYAKKQHDSCFPAIDTIQIPTAVPDPLDYHA